LQEAGLSDEDRKILEESMRELNGGIIRHKQNILNLANIVSNLEKRIEDTETKRS